MISPGSLRQRTAGNPLFLVRVVNELVRQGILQEGAGSCEGAEGLEAAVLGVPESLRHLCAVAETQQPHLLVHLVYLLPVQSWPQCCAAGAVRCQSARHLLRERIVAFQEQRLASIVDCSLKSSRGTS